MQILVCFGTRPEAIKLAPLIRELQRRKDHSLTVCSIGQHRELVDDVVRVFGVTADIALDVMTTDQELSALTARILGRMREVLTAVSPDVVVVQGDTTSAMAVALAAYQAGVPVAHVEAGLRTSTIEQPWPEEANRRVITRLAALHFAPTQHAADNLYREGVDPMTVVISGNTAIDAARFVDAKPAPTSQARAVITCHRREHHRDQFSRVGRFLRDLTIARPDVEFVLPIHPSPRVQPLLTHLADRPNLKVWQPLDYPTMLSTIQSALTVVTDSGGVQEECAWFGVPCLVMRRETDRPESVETGNAVVVDCDLDRAIASFERPRTGARGVFGDGYASGRIADALLRAQYTQT